MADSPLHAPGGSLFTPGLGSTQAERYLTTLCRRTFLSLWSYPNVFKDQGLEQLGEGKEVSDLIVVFEDHVFLFSDKDCSFPDTGNLSLDWTRWYRRAIRKSAKQVWGAERWVRQFPNRLFLDRECTVPFPFEFPNEEKAKYHLIVVAHNVSERCKAALGGSGSLMLMPLIGASTEMPFAVGDLDRDRTFVHVLGDTSLEVLLGTLDTISDLATYLERKEAFIRSGQLLSAAGEDDLVAYYHRAVGDDGHYFDIPDDATSLVVDEGFWEEFCESRERQAQLKANEISYSWDALIQKFVYHFHTDTQEFASHPAIQDQELPLRLMAREPRTRRRMLARALLELMEATSTDGRSARVVESGGSREPFYVFLVLARPSKKSDAEYREVRRNLLATYCMVVRYLRPEATDIVGIATEPAEETRRSEDLVYLDGRDWSADAHREAMEWHERGILKDVRRFGVLEQEFPTRPRRTIKLESQAHKYGRNQPCPCGSGLKYKKCCGKI